MAGLDAILVMVVLEVEVLVECGVRGVMASPDAPEVSNFEMMEIAVVKPIEVVVVEAEMSEVVTTAGPRSLVQGRVMSGQMYFAVEDDAPRAMLAGIGSDSASS